VPGARHVPPALEHAQHAPAGLGQLAHAPGGPDRDGHRLFGEQVLVRPQRGLGHLVVQGMAGEIVDGRDGRLGHHAAEVAVDLDLDVVLEIGDVLVGHGQRVPGELAHRRPLRRALAAARVHASSVFREVTKGRDPEVVDARLAQQPIAAQMGRHDPPAADDADLYHSVGPDVRRTW